LPVAVRAPLALLAALAFVQLANEWFSYWPSGALEAIRASLNLSYTEVGLVVASLSAGGLLGDGLSVAADFVDRRWLAFSGALAYAAGLLTFGLGHSLPVLLAAGFVWGVGCDGFLQGCEVALVDMCGDELPAALGRVNAYGALGDLLGPLSLAAVLALGLYWRVLFLAGGGLMLLYAAVLASQRFPERRVEPPEAPLTAVLSVLRDPRVLLLAGIDAVFGLLDEPLLGFLNAFLQRVRGWETPAATTLIAAVVASQLAGFISVGLAARLLSPRRLMAVTAALLTLGLVGLLASPWPWLQLAGGLLFGPCWAIFYSVLQATYLGLRPGQAGTTGAVVSLIGVAGLGFPAIVGAAADAYGLEFGILLYLLPAVLLLPLLVLERVLEQRRRSASLTQT
jgi:predicted MFS family arabinose efflux permease